MFIPGWWGVSAACPVAPPPRVELWIDDLLARAGDTGAYGTSRSQAEWLIEKAAGIVNAETRTLLREADITVTADTPFYTLSTLLPDLVRVVEIRDGEREIDEVQWDTVLLADDEPLALGYRVEAWGLLGRDTLMLWPPLTAAKTLTVVYAYEPDLVGCAQFDNPNVGRLLEMAEMLLSVRSRNLNRLAELLGPNAPPPLPLGSGRGTKRGTVGDAIDDLLSRAGDDPDQGFGTSRDQAKRIIEKAIGIVNANMPDTTTTVSLTVGADTPFYVLSSQIPRLAKIVEIRDAADREIDRAAWETILVAEPEPLAIGKRLEAWGVLGRDLLFLWPPLEAAQTVTVVYAEEPSLGADADSLDQDNMGMVMRIAEMLLAVRSKNLGRLAELLESI